MQRCVALKMVPCYITFKQQRRRQVRKRHLKSEFALPQTLSRLIHLIWFNSSNVGKLLWSWILKDCFKVREKEEKTVVFCSRPRQNVKTCVTAKKCAKRRDARAKLFFFANENLLVHCRSRYPRRRRCLRSIVYRRCRMPILVPMGITGCGTRDAGWGLRDWRKIWVGMTLLKNSNKGNPRTRFNIKKKCWKNIFPHRNNNSQNNPTASSDPETYNPWSGV